MRKQYKTIVLGCLSILIVALGVMVYSFIKVDDYCKSKFFDFLVLEGIQIEILKCSEYSNPFIPRTVKVARVDGDSSQINNFLSVNGFYQTDEYRGMLESGLFAPYSEKIKENDVKFFYRNFDTGLYMLYSRHLLFVNHAGATTFQN